MMKLETGSTVTIKVRNPIYPHRDRYASYMHIPEHNEFTGVVVRGHKAVGPHQIGLTTDDPRFTMRVIDLDRIVGMEDSLPAPNVSVKTYSIQGSKGNTYTVVHDRSAWTCDCAGFQFRRSCKHVDQLRQAA
jgi:hypothetical protein